MVGISKNLGREDLHAALSRNVRIDGRRTSVRLEASMWEALDDICDREGKTVNDICAIVARTQREGGFTSALRVYILIYYRNSAQHDGIKIK